MKNRRTKGSTLVECVVAIFIITSISAVAVLVLNSALKNIDKRWDKFSAILTADNILAAFQGSENSNDDFVKSMEALKCEVLKADEEYTYDFDSVTREDVESENFTKQLVTTDFAGVRATDNNGVVTFYSDAAFTKELFSITYGTGSKYYTQDLAYLAGTGLYQSAAVTQEAGTSKTINLSLSYDASSDQKYPKRRFNVTMTESSVTYTPVSGTAKTATATALDKWLFANEYYLSPKSGSISGNSGTIDYYVYDCNTKTKISNSSGDLIYQIAFSNFSLDTRASGTSKFDASSVLDTWYNDTSTKITSVSMRYGTSGSWTTLKNSSGTQVVASNTVCPYFIYISAYASQLSLNGSHIPFSCTSITPATAGNTYTDYKLKTADYIAYALEKDNTVELHESDLNNDDGKKLIVYRYSLTPTTGLLDLLTSKLSYEKNEEYTSGNLYGKYATVESISGLKFNDTDKTITFCWNNNQNALFLFNYGTDSVAYSNDKAAISDFIKYYDKVSQNEYKLKSAYVGAGSIARTNTGYDVVVTLSEGSAKVFSVHVSTVKREDTQGSSASGGFTEEKQTNEGYAVIKWYSCKRGDYVCVARAVFSETSFNNVKPSLKVWILTTDQYKEWSKSGKEMPSVDSYVDYQKG